MPNDIVKELGTNFIEYAVAVNTDRAIPDAKSGLKPVVKRILYVNYVEVDLIIISYCRAVTALS